MTPETLLVAFGGSTLILLVGWASTGTKVYKNWKATKVLRRKLTVSSWIVSSSGVRIGQNGKVIVFDTPGTATLVAPQVSGFEIKGTVKFTQLVKNDGGPNPDFRIYLSTTGEGIPMCFTIFPWENSVKRNNWFESHVNFSPWPFEGSGPPRLRQVPVCPSRQLPFKFDFVFRFSPDTGLTFTTSLGDNAPVAVNAAELTAVTYQIALPQYIKFSFSNCAGGLAIKEIRALK